MRINRINALAFGPLLDESLTLAPGLTVVVGDNESAKSSWHAAIYAALCGRRRRLGATTREERRFADLHRPWDGDKWFVSAIVTLDDGRTVEMCQDLDGKVDCRARDLDLGARDISNEIMFEGSPDASRWLGLDRRSFIATACVNQSELLRVLEQAEGLQDHLQRAAATAGTDATAAAALTRLEEFSRDRVGLDRANSSKPLRHAKRQLELARAALAAAQRAHGEYLAMVTGADTARREAREAAARADGLQQRATVLEELLEQAQGCVSTLAQLQRLRERAQSLTAQLTETTRHWERAAELDSQFGGIAPTGTVADDETNQLVTAALTAHGAAGTSLPLHGLTSAELSVALEALPPAPAGDTVIDGDVRSALSAFQQAQAVAEQHASDEPPPPDDLSAEESAVAIAGLDVVRELALALSSPSPVTNPQLSAAVAEATRDRDAAEKQHADAEQREHATQATLERVRAELAELGAPHTAPSATDEQRAWEPIATQQRARVATRRRTVLLMASAVLLLAGVLTLVVGPVAVGGFLFVLAVLTLAGSAVLQGRAPVAGPSPAPIIWRAGAVSEDLAAAQRRVQTADEAHRAAAEHVSDARQQLGQTMTEAARTQARLDARTAVVEEHAVAAREREHRCAQFRLPGDPVLLRQLAGTTEQHMAADRARRQWQERAANLQQTVHTATDKLTAALDARDAAPAEDLVARAGQYERDCSQRAAQQIKADRRVALERELAGRRAAEQAAANVAAARALADTALRRAAESAGVTGAATDPPEALATALRTWQQKRLTGLNQTDQAQQNWAELQTLLAGGPLSQLATAATELDSRRGHAQQEADHADLALSEALRTRDGHLPALEARVDPSADVSEIAAQVTAALADVRDRLAEARRAGTRQDHAAADADGALHERARLLLPVAEAEESELLAQTQLDQVIELDETLKLTCSFLERAQQRVHRDLAPVLASTLTEWLPHITGGRYITAAVDPRTLAIQVCGPSHNWRQADRLSHGTAEQVYLLLRVALAHHLVADGTTSPLLLDDVTVQADSKRTLQILDLLHLLSQRQQVILFAQEAQVADWAHANLTGPQDAVVELNPVIAA